MTTDDAFYVDMAQVAEFADDLRAFIERATDRVGVLNRAVDRLHISWEGESAEAHREAHARWVEGMSDMKDGLDDIARATTHSHEAFTGVQEHHRKMWP